MIKVIYRTSLENKNYNIQNKFSIKTKLLNLWIKMYTNVQTK